MDSEAGVALLSASAGLSAGLVLAYFRHRSERRLQREQSADAAVQLQQTHEAENQRLVKQLEAENERQRRQFESENQRLRQQLDAQAAEARSTREQADLLDWRDRRLDAYRAVSNAAFRAEELATQMAKSDPAKFFLAPKRPGHEFDEVFAELRVAIDEVELISGGDLREVADWLWTSADWAHHVSRQLADATQAFRTAEADAKEGKPVPADGSFARLLYVTVEEATERITEAKQRWEEAAPRFKDARKDWATKSRTSLGLPD